MSKQNTTHENRPFVGGYIIDEQGREQPITEDMIQQACQALQDKAISPKSAPQPETQRARYSC